MELLPFANPGRFWKGNLHTHSTRSDGTQPPQEVCRLYEQGGYDFIALTDHFLEQYGFPVTDTRPFRSEAFTTIIGAELHSGAIENGSPWHIVAAGLPLDFAPTAPEESGAQLAARAMQAGAFVGIAHPHWYTLTAADVDALGPAHAVEVYNGVAADANDRAESWHILDVLLDRRQRYFGYAADDAHLTDNYHDFRRGWVQVKAEALSPEALLTALKAGAFYSSTGPEIYDIDLTPGQRLTVHCSPAERIFLTGVGSAAQRAWGNGLTSAEFDLSDWSSHYCRVTVRDRRGGRAWSNPIWLEE
ncbi:MAG: CehA/McbA family metallohydrolase [Caldilineaceae bacterium]|nr:CehA/McbA family metallohydrolase [Caldilineaceae bacterium]